jgi:hypothetical protein
MDGWMDGWMDRETDRQMDGWMDRRGGPLVCVWRTLVGGGARSELGFVAAVSDGGCLVGLQHAGVDERPPKGAGHLGMLLRQVLGGGRVLFA